MIFNLFFPQKFDKGLWVPLSLVFPLNNDLLFPIRTFLVAQRLKHLPGMRETQVWSLGQEDPLEKEMATHSSTLTWRIPWKEEPGGLQSKRSQRVGHDWATSLSLSLFTYFQLHQFAHTVIISLTLFSLTSLLFFFF